MIAGRSIADWIMLVPCLMAFGGFFYAAGVYAVGEVRDRRARKVR